MNVSETPFAVAVARFEIVIDVGDWMDVTVEFGEIPTPLTPDQPTTLVVLESPVIRLLPAVVLPANTRLAVPEMLIVSSPSPEAIVTFSSLAEGRLTILKPFTWTVVVAPLTTLIVSAALEPLMVIASVPVPASIVNVVPILDALTTGVGPT